MTRTQISRFESRADGGAATRAPTGPASRPESRPALASADPLAAVSPSVSPVSPAPYQAPIDFETDCIDLPVRGELPAALVGTLYRNGPNPQFPEAAAHWFSGDGMIHAFRLGGGRASYRNRWIRTVRFDAERAAGHALRGHSMLANEDGTGNTSLVGHGGRLFALEEGHLPIAIDPRSLATLGPEDFGGRYRAPFTAHPKIDPATGELVYFGYGTTGPLTAGMAIGTIDPAGEPGPVGYFDAPYPSMVHDFAITEHFVVFPVLPLVGSLERARQGGPPFAWEPEHGARIGLLRRGADPAIMAWFDGEPCYAFHVMNAFETRAVDGSLRVMIDVMRFDEPPLFPWPDGQPTDPRLNQARLSRWTLDLGSTTRRFVQSPLDDRPGEFPRIDERWTGRPYRHGWIAASRRLDPTRLDSADRLDCLVHYDHFTGRQAAFPLPRGDRLSEPVFVARPGAVEEGDGWLLAVIYRARENRSDLAVFEARDVADGPVATVLLPHRVPAGFHGYWLPQG